MLCTIAFLFSDGATTQREESAAKKQDSDSGADAPAPTAGSDVVEGSAASPGQPTPVPAALDCDALQFARFLGLFLGKSLFDRQLLGFSVSKMLLKKILGSPPYTHRALTDAPPLGKPAAKKPPVKAAVTASSVEKKSNSTSPAPKIPVKAAVKVESESVPPGEKALPPRARDVLDDLDRVDPQLASSLRWVRDNDITDVLCETFSAPGSALLGAGGKEMALCRGGCSAEVSTELRVRVFEFLNRILLLMARRFLFSFSSYIPTPS
jgi:hypothetical protein